MQKECCIGKEFDKIFVVADSHFLSDLDDKSASFINLVKNLPSQNCALVLLGDLFVLWSAFDKNLSPAQIQILETVQSYSKKGGLVAFLVGNKDLFFSNKMLGQAIPPYDNNTQFFDLVANDFLVLKTKKFRVHFHHGDLIDKTDYKYRVFRMLVRSTVLKIFCRLLPSTMLSQIIFFASTQYNKKSKRYRYKVPINSWRNWLLKLNKKQIADISVVGHFHPQNLIDYKVDGLCGIILPAWFDSMHYLTIDDQGYNML